MAAFFALLIGVATGCGGHPSQHATSSTETTVIKQLASIKHRLAERGYGPFYIGWGAGSFLANLGAPPPKTSFYVPMHFLSVHAYNFCVFVFRSPDSAMRFARKLEQPSFRPNPWAQSTVVRHGSVVYWGAANTRLIRPPKGGAKPRYYGYDTAEFRHLVAVAEAAA
jgi:hypothetical protein